MVALTTCRTRKTVAQTTIYVFFLMTISFTLQSAFNDPLEDRIELMLYLTKSTQTYSNHTVTNSRHIWKDVSVNE